MTTPISTLCSIYAAFAHHRKDFLSRYVTTLFFAKHLAGSSEFLKFQEYTIP